MDADNIPKGQSRERTDGRPINQPGVYKHKLNPDAPPFITQPGDAWVVQADALLSPNFKDQWERTGDVPTALELLEMRKAQEVKDATEAALEEGKQSAELKEATKAALERAKAL